MGDALKGVRVLTEGGRGHYFVVSRQTFSQVVGLAMRASAHPVLRSTFSDLQYDKLQEEISDFRDMPWRLLRELISEH